MLFVIPVRETMEICVEKDTVLTGADFAKVKKSDSKSTPKPAQILVGTLVDAMAAHRWEEI